MLSINMRAPSQRETLLSLTGEIDYASSQQLRAAVTAVLRTDVDTLTISLAGVTFIDSTGIGTLVVARRICKDMRIVLRVTDINPSVARLIAMSGSGQALGLHVPATRKAPERVSAAHSADPVAG